MPDGRRRLGGSYPLFPLAGVNDADGIRYQKVPASGTAQVKNLTVESNVEIPGVWMYRVDADNVSKPQLRGEKT